ncbi:MAG: deoxyribodipyrimidine photo-lyase [Cyanobacteriota bacterium]|nr:deoxyribodipyrimidine photo-lyase [Cyanobacteriota bacterium]
MNDPILLWHRRDLRLHDNTALAHAYRLSPLVIPIFILDPEILHRSDTAPARVQFMLDSLREMQDRYAQISGQLVVRRGDPLLCLRQVIEESQARTILWNEDVEPFAQQRDRRVRAGLEALGIQVITCQDQLLHGPGEVLTQVGDPYSVYTPFWRNWSRLEKGDPYPPPRSLTTLALPSLPLPDLAGLGMTCSQQLPPAGETAALDHLDRFCLEGGLFAYEQQRNHPAVAGTSQLSPYLRWGNLGIRQLWQTLKDAEPEIRSDAQALSLQTWQQEIAWREFYKHVLAFWPQVETRCYRQDFDRLEWDNQPDHFQAWCRGETGYPIVDAAMRQLNQTGWMHNRCRMIVASFLTKDLLIDWRWGEQYFMQNLVDGDLAANNGGWQWSASVGTDAKPLRIFNPWTQASKFDPEGRYIRHYLPELAGLSTAHLLEAHPPALTARRRLGYPDPIVDHKQRQHTFKHRYQACRGTAPPSPANGESGQV